MKTVTLTTCENAAQAHILQGALANEGIDSILHNEIMSSILPNFYGIMGSGVQVLVKEEDYEAALAITRKGFPETGNVCPYCGSAHIERSLGKRKWQKMFFIFLSVLQSAPLGNIRMGYRCRQCGEEFETPADKSSRP